MVVPAHPVDRVVLAGLNIERDNQANLPFGTYQPVANGADPNLQGRYLQVQARLTADAAGTAGPVVYDVAVENVTGLACYVDADGDVDKLDISVISRGRGQRAQPGDPRDSDGDGLITPNDAKVCIQKCTRASCAIQ